MAVSALDKMLHMSDPVYEDAGNNKMLCRVATARGRWHRLGSQQNLHGNDSLYFNVEFAIRQIATFSIQAWFGGAIVAIVVINRVEDDCHQRLADILDIDIQRIHDPFLMGICEWTFTKEIFGYQNKHGKMIGKLRDPESMFGFQIGDNETSTWFKVSDFQKANFGHVVSVRRDGNGNRLDLPWSGMSTILKWAEAPRYIDQLASA